MPAERGMGIEQVVELLRNYDFSHQRRLSSNTSSLRA